MKALRLNAWRSEPVLEDVDPPDPGPGEVVVNVGGAGACHSDLHLMELPPGVFGFDPPFTLGHEIAGWVDSLGPGAGGYEIGEAVAVHGAWGCGVCNACRAGTENYCDDFGGSAAASGAGLGRDGAMAEKILVPSTRHLVPIGDLSPVEASPLTDAGVTPYHAIKRSLDLLVPGSTAVVIGVGGLGHLAVQMLKVLSPASVIAIDSSEAKTQLALDVGADHAFEPAEAASNCRELTGGNGAELVIDFVGSTETMQLAAAAARVRGAITVVGLAAGFLNYSIVTVPLECSVASTYWGGINDLVEVIALARTGKIKVRTTTFPLSEALTAYDLLKKGEISGRAVITPNS